MKATRAIRQPKERKDKALRAKRRPVAKAKDSKRVVSKAKGSKKLVEGKKRRQEWMDKLDKYKPGNLNLLKGEANANVDLKRNYGTFHAGIDVGVMASDVTRCTVLFREAAEKLVELIDETSKDGFICCAVAWFTNAQVLEALARAKGRGALILVVVQKEEFLSPDICTGGREKYSTWLRGLYDRLGSFPTGWCPEIQILMAAKPFDDGLNEALVFDMDANTEVGCVRCFGNYNSGSSPSFPRMHNKFFVFGDVECGRAGRVGVAGEMGEQAQDGQSGLPPEHKFLPKQVWTGSYNVSAAAELSFENVNITESPTVAQAYLAEFSLLFLLSEPLDWTSRWIAPTISYRT